MAEQRNIGGALVNDFPQALSSVEIYGQKLGACGEACILAAHALLHHSPCRSTAEFTELHQSASKQLKPGSAPRDYADLKSMAGILGLATEILPMEGLYRQPGLKLVRIEWGRTPPSPEPGTNGPLNFMYDDEHYVLVYGAGEGNIHFWEPSFGWRVSATRRSLDEARYWLGSGTPFWNMPRHEFMARNEQVRFVPTAPGWFLSLDRQRTTEKRSNFIWAALGMAGIGLWLNSKRER